MRNYLNISQSKDLENPKEKILYRLLEIFPGFLSWGVLISAILLSAFAPVVVAIFIILFDLYWLLKVSYLAFHQVVSFLQMKKNLKINWLEKLTEVKNWKEIYHLIILPVFKEKKEIVEESLKAILDSKYPKDKMLVVLATEERAGQEIQKTAKEIEKKFKNQFLKFLVTTHPKNLPGEVAGKGSNVAWAIKTAKEKIIEPLKIAVENIIVSDFDADTKPEPQYFACLTFHFLTVPEPRRSSYQPIPIYNNNIWQAPAFSRVVATSGTFWQMMQQERPELLVTYSSHSMPFKILEEVGYPKNVVSDDSRIFWKSYLFYDGDYRVIPLYYPVSMDAVLTKNLPQTIISQYKQQRRWAWGAENIPYLLFSFLKNRKISFLEKLRRSIDILDGFWSWSTSSLLIFFLGWLPLILGGEKFNITLLSYNLPRLVSNLMTLAMGGMIISAALSFKILPSKPKNSNFFKNFSMIFQWLLLPITLIFFGALPALDAQTRLMLGKHLGFWATEKSETTTHPPPEGEGGGRVGVPLKRVPNTMNEILSYTLYIVYGILPSLIWLNFYLRKDVRPEPKLMILKIFCYGMLATLPAFFFETAIFGEFSKLNFSSSVFLILNVFLGVALVEESLKFLMVKFGVLKNPEFDEPIDAMIYMITAALGFAAGENILILVPLKYHLFSEIFDVSLLRFLGATFLHTLSSGICGFFIGLSFFNTKRRWRLVSIGLVLAILLHGFYNFSIMKGEGSLKILIPLLLLLTSAIFVSFGFKKLKK